MNNIVPAYPPPPGPPPPPLGPPPPPLTPIALAPPAPPALALTLDQIMPGQVDPEAVERLQEQERQAILAGFAPKPPIYALGTRVLPIGADNFRRSRLEFEAQPPALTALAQFVQRVLLEQRSDVETQVNQMRMLESGQITRGRGPLGMSDNGFRQLIARSGCPDPGAAATYLSHIPADRRAKEVNHWLMTADDDKSMVLRTRNTLTSTGRDGRQVYAAVSTRYTPFDVDEVAKLLMMQQIAPGDARAEIIYDGDRCQMMLRWHSDVQPHLVAAGEIFRASAGIKTADDGTLSLVPFAGLDRNLCLNLIVLDLATMSLGKRRHVGSDIGTQLYSGLADAVQKVAWFAEAWDGARSHKLTDEGVVRDAPDGVDAEALVAGVMRGLMRGGQPLQLPGIRKKDTVESLMGSWRKEPELTKAGVVNAITRTAHEVPMRGEWATSELEQAASRVLSSKKPLQWAGETEEF